MNMLSAPAYRPFISLVMASAVSSSSLMGSSSVSGALV
jgi:hypothetical protein